MRTDGLKITYHRFKGSFSFPLSLSPLIAAQENNLHMDRCLMCFTTETDRDCHTCKRAYHAKCLAVFEPLRLDPFYCPLCLKRMWDIIPPSNSMEAEGISLVIAGKFLEDSSMVDKMTLRDTGSLSCDHRLLLHLKEYAEKKNRDLSQPPCVP